MGSERSGDGSSWEDAFEGNPHSAKMLFCLLDSRLERMMLTPRTRSGNVTGHSKEIEEVEKKYGDIR